MNIVGITLTNVCSSIVSSFHFNAQIKFTRALEVKSISNHDKLSEKLKYRLLL